MNTYLHEVHEELRLLGESFLERFRFTHWRKPHVFEQRITGEDLQMTCTQVSCRNKTVFVLDCTECSVSQINRKLYALHRTATVLLQSADDIESLVIRLLLTVCLASHWPCVTDLSDLSTYIATYRVKA